MIQLVIFDCDGVLVDSEPIANAVFAKHLSAIGFVVTAEQAMARFMGRSMASCLAEVAKELADKSVPLPVGFPSKFLEAMQNETYLAFENDLQSVEGIEQAIQKLGELGIKRCVASSGDHQKMSKTLGLTNLQRFFEGRIFSATQVANGKPAPDLFLFAATQMKVMPEYCLVVEDSPAGVQAALRAQMQVLAYAGRTNPDVFLGLPEWAAAQSLGYARVFRSMASLPNLVQNPGIIEPA